MSKLDEIKTRFKLENTSWHSDHEDIAWLISRVEQLEREYARLQEQCDHKDRLLEDNQFTCPRCGATSYNPNDKREGYCGRCHDWTAPSV